MKLKQLLFSLFVGCALVASFAQQMPFQGKLLVDAEPFTGTATMIFSIPEATWTETLSDVPVQDGFYAVTLGLTTPLPTNLFQTDNQVEMNISVNGEPLSPVNLYAPFTNLNIQSSDIRMTGPNGNLNMEIGDRGVGLENEGQIRMYNSSGRAAVFLQGRDNGGRLQLSNVDPTGTFNTSAFLAGTNTDGNGAFIQMNGLNPAGDGNAMLVNIYNTAGGPPPTFTPYSNGYRRGGIDIFDNEGRLLSYMSLERNESGSDPTGKSGYLGLQATTTANIMMGGKNWENNDLGYIHLFGLNDNGGGWFVNNFSVEATDIGGGESGARLSLANTANGGVRTEAITMETNFADSRLGYIQVSDAAGASRAHIRGDGNISVNRAIDGQSAINMFDDGTGDGGIAIISSTDVLRLFFNADDTDGVFRLSNTVGGTTVSMAANTGEVIVSGDVTANGILLTSDKRLKEQIKPLTGSLSSVRKLQGVNYYWKDKSKGEKQQIGFIAQDMEKVFPELVSTNESGFKSVNYVQLTAVLVEAIKELEQKVIKLETENTSLKANLSDVQKLRQEMDALKAYIGSGKAASN